jgi:uncharacterized protein (DUF1330 family)
MAAYVIANVTVQDPESFEEYRKQVPETIARYGGRYLVRGGQHEALEGGGGPHGWSCSSFRVSSRRAAGTTARSTGRPRRFA